MTTRPIRLEFTGGSTAFIHLPYEEVTQRIAKAQRQGHGDLQLNGRRIVLDRVVAVLPPAPATGGRMTHHLHTLALPPAEQRRAVVAAALLRSDFLCPSALWLGIAASREQGARQINHADDCG